MKNKQNNKCVCIHENIRLIIRGHSKSTYVRPDLPVFDPPLFVPVRSTCNPSSTYVRFSELPIPLPSKKVSRRLLRLFRIKNREVKREKRRKKN